MLLILAPTWGEPNEYTQGDEQNRGSFSHDSSIPEKKEYCGSRIEVKDETGDSL
jgi:hypothetical protein